MSPGASDFVSADTKLHFIMQTVWVSFMSHGTEFRCMYSAVSFPMTASTVYRLKHNTVAEVVLLQRGTCLPVPNRFPIASSLNIVNLFQP